MSVSQGVPPEQPARPGAWPVIDDLLERRSISRLDWATACLNYPHPGAAPPLVEVDPSLGPEVGWEIARALHRMDPRYWTWDRIQPNRGKHVGGWLHRRLVLIGRDLLERLHHRYTLVEDFDDLTWPLVERSSQTRRALMTTPAVGDPHLGIDGARLGMELDEVAWSIAQRAARLTSLRRTRDASVSRDKTGLLPTETVTEVDSQLQDALTGIKALLDELEVLARHIRDVDDRYQAWLGLQQLTGRHEDFLELAASDAADHHLPQAWGGHYQQARTAAEQLSAAVNSTQHLLDQRTPTSADR
ncbi:hypothetical protein ACIQ9Q_39925 [Streptomyces sp. NPDC094438]|uniref:hypothetical protein n=1 Tax=Streptomyces sp. NPDC094438 TaxID=3366061 RepID=UPI00380AF1F0